MNLEGQQLLGVHIVERAQVRQFEQQLGEDGRLVGVVLGDEAAQGTDQRLLQGFHRIHILYARTICENGQSVGQTENYMDMVDQHWIKTHLQRPAPQQ